MPRILSCPQGHQWALRETDASSATGLQVLCPVCGAAVELDEPEHPASTPPPASPSSPSSAGAETGTYQSPGADKSEAETLAPKTPPHPDLAEPAEVLPAPEESKPAPEIPGYEIVGELGRGGMGMVYKARQSKLDRLVALKILPQETSSDSTFAERFTREARALAQLNHSNIVAVYDFGQAGNLSYFVMEYVDGANLRQLMRSGPIAPLDTLRIMAQICEALQYAHEEGIVHRDIKPENILRDKRGRVKIADFGIAKLLSRKTTNYTLTGPWQVVGTFNYMAPEQIENPQKLDHRADIYSLGVMFYEMLTGGLPMGRFALPSQKAQVDRRIDEVVLRALEKEPERRYQHARELKAAIDAFLASGALLVSGASHGPGSTDRARTATLSGGTTPVAHAPGSGQEVLSVQPASTAPWPREFPSAIPVGLARDQIRQRLNGLGTGLKITGIVHCVSWGLFLGSAIAAEWIGKTSASAAFAFLPGILIIIGGRKIQKLEGYTFGLLACCLAMLPCSPGFFLGLPMGIWTLMVLRRPEVRAAFSDQTVPPTPARSIPVLTPAPVFKPRRKGLFRRIFGTTTGWAMILCMVGSSLIFSEWARYDVPKHSPIWLGYETGLGIATESIFIGLFLLLFITSFMDPVPFWRAAVMFLAGATVILLSSLSSIDSRGLEHGAVYAIVLGAGVVLLAALQVRGILMNRRPTSI